MAEQYRKKPVVIEAMRYDGTTDGRAAIAGWLARNGWSTETSTGGHFLIPTLEGHLEAAPGDWIIKGVKGEFYPCKPDIFDATYEAVTDTEQPAPDLTFRQVIETNRVRCRRWHGPDTEPWSGADWSNAMCGEAGEAANVVKKLRRNETGTAGHTWDTVPLGHDVPGSGVIIEKRPHAPARGWHIVFRRTEPDFARGEEWITFHLGSDPVPIRLTEHGLEYPVPHPATDALTRQLGHEIADTILYALLLADHYGIDVPAALVEKFNIVSERQGFPERLP